METTKPTWNERSAHERAEIEPNIVAAYKDGTQISTIRRAWNISYGTVYEVLQRHNIPLRGRNVQRTATTTGA